MAAVLARARHRRTPAPAGRAAPRRRVALLPDPRLAEKPGSKHAAELLVAAAKKGVLSREQALYLGRLAGAERFCAIVAGLAGTVPLGDLGPPSSRPLPLSDQSKANSCARRRWAVNRPARRRCLTRPPSERDPAGRSPRRRPRHRSDDRARKRWRGSPHTSARPSWPRPLRPLSASSVTTIAFLFGPAGEIEPRGGVGSPRPHRRDRARSSAARGPRPPPALSAGNTARRRWLASPRTYQRHCEARRPLDYGNSRSHTYPGILLHAIAAFVPVIAPSGAVQADGAAPRNPRLPRNGTPYPAPLPKRSRHPTARRNARAPISHLCLRRPPSLRSGSPARRGTSSRLRQSAPRSRTPG